MSRNFDPASHQLLGPAGALAVPPDDAITRKLLMLIAGAVGGLGPTAAAAQLGFSKQRSFPLRAADRDRGALALRSGPRGPKTRSRRTDEAVRQIIRQRFRDPEASADVLAQKLRPGGLPRSTRSVARVGADFGLPKKTSLRAVPVPFPRSTPTPRAAGTGAVPAPPRHRKPVSVQRWPIGSRATGSVCGCSSRSTSAWEPGSGCAVGVGNRAGPSNRAGPCNGSTKRP
jgi:hypothetical protein